MDSPLPERGARALDVGCGTGRWCRMLAGKGYRAVGIDISRKLIEINRKRDPQCEFVCGTIQNYHSAEPFNLISLVNVLQHIPFREQERAIENLRRLVWTGGFVLILENLVDEGHHVFSNTYEQWCEKFRQAGFALVAMQRYDYNPVLRTLTWIWKWTGAVKARHRPDILDVRGERGGRDRSIKICVKHVGQFLGMVADGWTELLLVACNFSLASRHCGFLFRAI